MAFKTCEICVFLLSHAEPGETQFVCIPPEDSEAERRERHGIRDGFIAKAARLLQSTYGRKYSGDMLTEVEKEIDSDLGEKPFEKHSLREQLQQQPHDMRDENKDKRREYDR